MQKHLNITTSHHNNTPPQQHLTIMHKIFLSLLLSVAAFTSTYAYDWLARIDDDRRVCRLSIPGTHDACTGYGFLPQDTLAGNYIARTQELNISEQWAVGVRAFDLRPDVREEKSTKSSKKAKETKRTLQIYHGEFATQQTFNGVFNVLRDSLQAHPTEFAIIIMQHERSTNRDGSTWEAMVDYALAENSDLIVDFRPDLTVGQLRGRILVLSRDTYRPTPRGGYIKGWRFDAEVDWQKPATMHGYAMEGTLCVQDFYNMTWEGGTTAKLEAIERLLKAANSEEVAKQYPNMWFINHTSGFKYTSTEFTKEPVSTSEGYRANAADTNKFLAERIKGHMTTGLVMMDFAGVDRSGNYDVMGKRLVQAVINSN